MNIYKYFILVMLLLCSITIHGQGGYNPNDPPEPNATYSLDLQAFPAGSGNVSSGGKYAGGTSVYVSAGNVGGFRFKHWKRGDDILSTASGFYYTMPAEKVTLIAVFDYEPGNPEDPNTIFLPTKSKLYLNAQPASGGHFNISSGNTQEEGKSIYLYATPNTGFRFIEWRDGEVVISENQNFYFSMPGVEKTLTAVFVYDPGSPGDPNVPSNIEHGLTALTQYGEAGQTIVFPIYLLNHNISVHSVDFDITFPEGVVVDSENAVLTVRGNGQTIAVSDLGDHTYRYSIGNESSDDFSESNGVLINIPVTLSAQLTPGVAYPVEINNVVLGAASGIINSSAHNGALGVNKTSENSILANFYSNVYLNRVNFTNLSSESAESFAWNFGDGATSVETNPLHVYETAGSYEVRLIASNTEAVDTLNKVVTINPEATWNVAGTLSLNKHKKDIKNFSSVAELFSLLVRSNISGDITIQVEAGETFDISASEETLNNLLNIQNKLTEGKKKLIFRKDGEADRPAIRFTGTFDAGFANSVIQWGRFVETEEVDILIYNRKIDLPAIYRFSPQRVCSGTAPNVVDFTSLGTSLDYEWELLATPESITGYMASGTNSIPSVTLTNNSNRIDSLKYRVSILYTNQSVAETIYSFDYKIEVTPAIGEEINIVSPVDNQVLNSSIVTLSWSSVANATAYELFIWEVGQQEPAQATVLNIAGTSYQSSAMFQYGKSYQWKVVARNECNRIVSETASFELRLLPDLHVTAITSLNSLPSGQQTEIEWTVQNDGSGATLPSEYWNDRIWLIGNLQSNNTSNYGYLLGEKQNKNALDVGESYSDKLDVTIPDYIAGTYYIVVTSDMRDIVSIDWTPIGGSNPTAPVPYTPDVSGTPYPYLKAQTTSGYNRILEEKETNTLTDNFFYKQITVTLPTVLPDLQVKTIEIPENVIETKTFTATATIVNAGEVAISGRTRTDGVYISKSAVFDAATATLVAVKESDHALEPEGEYVVTFELTAPVDSAATYYYYFVTDHNNSFVESDELNNRLRSNPVTVNPYLINESDYSGLAAFYNQTGGSQWSPNQWNTASKRVTANWPGVTFTNGRVTAISLPYNHLSGNIPALIAGFTELTDLDLSHNQLTGIEAVLPESIVRLDIQSQNLGEDSITLSLQPALEIPSIAKYSHANRNFDFYPSYRLYRSGTLLLTYNHDGNGYKRQFPAGLNPRDFVWRYESGTEFSLIQVNGLTSGSTITLKLGFDVGDANIDDQINVLDVQHSLNFIFNEHTSAFNFTAADTYKDNQITVQDLIKTINVILDDSGSNPAPGSGSASLRSSLPETNNRLYIESGKLKLYTEQAVAALDIALEGISERELSVLLDDADFQYIANDSGNNTRFIAFSLSGKVIPEGTNILAEWSKENVSIANATLSSPEAESIPVSIVKSETNVSLPQANQLEVVTDEGRILCKLSDHADKLTASLYTVQGVKLGAVELKNIPAGKHLLNFNAGRQSVYILKLQLETDGQLIYKNIKLIL
jgi:PKD repeat protein